MSSNNVGKAELKYIPRIYGSPLVDFVFSTPPPPQTGFLQR